MSVKTNELQILKLNLFVLVTPRNILQRLTGG